MNARLRNRRKMRSWIGQGTRTIRCSPGPDHSCTPGAHDLRHFYASGLIAAGCDVVTVQRALGHSKATTTLNTYAHLWPTAEDRTRTAAGALMVEAEKAADSLRTDEAPTGS